jgi:hypothetical protein
MDEKAIAKVNEEIYKQFPYLQGIAPDIKTEREGIFRLQYKGSVQTANDRTLPIIVNIVADEQGNIKKLTTSR